MSSLSYSRTSTPSRSLTAVFREKEMVPVLGKAKEIAVGGEMYAGVRVFDAK